MSIHSMGMAGGFGGALVYTAPDGSQRFDREQVSRKMSEDPDFGTVMTGDELYQWLDDEISRNQEQKKTPADLIKDSCIGWSSAKFRFTGNTASSGNTMVSETAASGNTMTSEEMPATEQQLALLFEDKEAVGADRTSEERWEQSFEQIAPDAPEQVKKAWLDAAERAGVDGMGVSRDGKLTHITQMMVQKCIRWQRGESHADLLGSSAGSALRAAEKALYALEHPREEGRVVSPEKRKNMEKEKTFYLEFIKRLQETA